jgi:hypothetical protein
MTTLVKLPPMRFCAARIVLSLTFFIANLAAQAEQQTNPFAFVETKVVDSFSIGVRDDDGHTNGAPELGLTFALWSTNGWSHIALPPFESLYKLELFDENGAAVEKTETGKKVETKFDDFAESKAEREIRANFLADRKGGADAWLEMIRPSDLFAIKKPGKYTLQIWFQIVTFHRTGPEPGQFERKLIRFPSLDYPLVEPEPIKRQ